MFARTQRVASTVEFPSACRQLAARVIDQALKDVLRAGQTSNGQSARSFLSGSWMLYYWCEVAGFDPLRVIQFAGMLMAGGHEPPDATWRKWLATDRSQLERPEGASTDGLVTAPLAFQTGARHAAVPRRRKSAAH
jgi:hypothetical protein